MPRLNPRRYLQAHDKLRRLWLRDPGLFAELSPTDQWLLHDFFQPDRPLTDLQLLQHRELVTQQRPSLPHQAGRALERFWASTAQVGDKRVARAKAPAGPTKRVRQADGYIVAKGLVQPEVDAKKQPGHSSGSTTRRSRSAWSSSGIRKLLEAMAGHGHPASVLQPVALAPGVGQGSTTIAPGPPVLEHTTKNDLCNGGRLSSYRPSCRSVRYLTLSILVVCDPRWQGFTCVRVQAVGTYE
jgi:hypothetical protein